MFPCDPGLDNLKSFYFVGKRVIGLVTYTKI